MKTFFHLITLLFFPFILFDAMSQLHGHAEPGIASNNGAGKGELMVYTGNFKSPKFTYDISIHIEMDPSIGFRYEVLYVKGESLLSDIIIFYKFSQPNQSVVYNRLNHQSHVSNSGNRGVNTPEMEVIGSETIDQYSCTHLQNNSTNNGHTSRDDFWMSKDLQGFQVLTKILNEVSPAAGSFAYNGIIFKWGGLVRMTHYFEDKKTRVSQSAEINLTEATPLNFPTKDFDVPSK
jgi:hypothetical protein